MNVLRVFTNKKGEYGNPVDIIPDTSGKLDQTTRQKIAQASGFSETVFIDDAQTNHISIFSPKRQIPFAGHAAVGAAYYLSQKNHQPIKKLISLHTSIKTWAESGQTWVSCPASSLPDWQFQELSSPQAVESITRGEAQAYQHTFVWSWINSSLGTIRARTFAPDWGIPEDEANGSGSMKLALQLKKSLEIHHGQGSVIFAKSLKSDHAAVGGRVTVIS